VSGPWLSRGTQAQAFFLFTRKFYPSGCAGRGAFTLSTLQPLPTEPLDIPALCLAGQLRDQNNATVNLDLSGATPAPGGGALSQLTAWPEFHNGAASALRLLPEDSQLMRTWIVYNKPEEPSYAHAGMVMALGLTGTCPCFLTDVY
jgi:anaphase-promoting complex subunit 1